MNKALDPHRDILPPHRPQILRPALLGYQKWRRTGTPHHSRSRGRKSRPRRVESARIRARSRLIPIRSRRSPLIRIAMSEFLVLARIPRYRSSSPILTASVPPSPCSEGRAPVG
jgi:hypothetical protein